MKSKMKKLVSLVLAMAMVFTMSAVVFADNTSSITINGTTSGVEYSVYKLMDLSVDSSGSAYTYTVNDDFESVLTAAMTEVGQTGDAATYLSTCTDDQVQKFANAVYNNLGTATATATDTASDTSLTFTGLAYGYYLVVEESAGDNSVSLVMLDTADADGAEVTTKEAVPVFTKKLQDINDSTSTTKTDWQDSADYDIGDSVPYRLTSTLPSKLAYYDTYKLIFHDVMQPGLTFNDDVTVYAGTTQVSTECYSVLTGANVSDGDCTFEVVINDVKTLKDTNGDLISGIDSSTMIYVYYTATLNKDAVIGNPGNWNTAQLEYSNNPYASGDGTDHETGKTPEETVVVLTYDVTINKINSAGDAVSGAEFTLEKYNATSKEWESKRQVTGTSDSVFSFTGLDDGWYRITETVTPSGYTGLDAPIYFIVTGTHTETSPDADEPLTKLEYDVAEWDDTAKTATADSSATTTFSVVTTIDSTHTTLASTDIVNKSGSVLPSTGGIGTTIFYIVGAVLVLGAGVILVTRRRTRA